MNIGASAVLMREPFNAGDALTGNTEPRHLWVPAVSVVVGGQEVIIPLTAAGLWTTRELATARAMLALSAARLPTLDEAIAANEKASVTTSGALDIAIARGNTHREECDALRRENARLRADVARENEAANDALREADRLRVQLDAWHTTERMIAQSMAPCSTACLCGGGETIDAGAECEQHRPDLDALSVDDIVLLVRRDK